MILQSTNNENIFSNEEKRTMFRTHFLNYNNMLHKTGVNLFNPNMTIFEKFINLSAN